MLHKTHDHTCSWGAIPTTACTCVLSGGRRGAEVSRGGKERKQRLVQTHVLTQHMGYL